MQMKPIRRNECARDPQVDLFASTRAKKKKEQQEKTASTNNNNDNSNNEKIASVLWASMDHFQFVHFPQVSSTNAITLNATK